MVSAGMSVLPQNCSQGAVKVKRIICQKKKKKKKTIVNKKIKKLRKLSFSYYINFQGCALAVPKSLWHPLFALEQ